MNNPIVYIPGLLLVGVIAGVMVTLQRDDTGGVAVASLQADDPAETQASAGQPDPRIDKLVAQVEALTARLEALESSENQVAGELEVSAITEAAPTPQQVAGFTQRTFGRDQQNPEAFTDTLIEAGVDPSTADAISRRQSELQLKRLELRDKATREGYLRTPQYRDELRSLMSADVSIREEVGDEYYDRYLYLSGQPNRIGVRSVITGSAAEQAGINQGDVIVSYDDSRVYNWNDLNSATTTGDRNEYVNVTVRRGESEFLVSVPRGPLGVRLSPTREDPDNG